jgi:hypothetical protein
MNRTAVIDVVNLTRRAFGPATPFLSRIAASSNVSTIGHVTPAVTCSVHATYLTGQWPSVHGAVANGWYFRDECEVRFWRQSNKLVQAEKVWETARRRDPSFTCANLFWWYNMYSGADYSLTPRPMYPADGRKIPDVYTQPETLRRLQDKLGQFPLFNYWGPNSGIVASKWIVEAAIETDRLCSPTLTLVYLPHMDYSPQKFGPADPAVAQEWPQIDQRGGGGVVEVAQDQQRGVGARVTRGAQVLRRREEALGEQRQVRHGAGGAQVVPAAGKALVDEHRHGGGAAARVRLRVPRRIGARVDVAGGGRAALELRDRGQARPGQRVLKASHG